MPIFKSPNSFSQNFKKKTPFRLGKDDPSNESGGGTEKNTTDEAADKVMSKKEKRKEFWKKAKTKADEIGMEMLSAPPQSDPYL
tara:strand:+ start:463 stop:714 length:252 start_codon:yes stop_codon:yes gene_type:complete